MHTFTLDDVSPDFLARLAEESARFAEPVRRRAAPYPAEGRVGPLLVEPARISAGVRGTRTYRTAWTWNGETARSTCSCSQPPRCEHAYALAARILALRKAPAPPPPGPAAVAEELADWARRRARVPDRTLRALVGLDLAMPEAPLAWLETRLTSPRHADAPRTRQQLDLLAAELRADPTLLAPPHARLLRWLARIGSESPYRGPTRVALDTRTLNQLLDSFTNSPLVTWAASESAEGATARVRIEAGGRLKLGESTVDIVPVSAGEQDDLHVALAARWPDGRRERLDEIVYFAPSDDLNPGLVLADGTFWRVGEAPPEHVVQRLAKDGSMAVPRQGREQFLSALAAGFSSVDHALGSHVLVHRTRPLVTLELGSDDWLHVRLFAHTGDAAWYPGSEAPGVLAFELDRNGEWVKLAPGAPGADASADLGPIETPPAATREEGAEGSAPAVPDSAAEPGQVWIELPDPEPLAPVREWLATLPFAQGGARLEARRRRSPERADRGGWILMGPSKPHDLAHAWERRPRHAAYLGNERMRNLLGDRRIVRARVSIIGSGVDFFTVSARWEAEGMSLSPEDLEKLRTSQSPFVKLGSGWARREWVEAAEAEAAELADLGIEVGAGEQRLSLVQLALARPESLAALESLGADARTLGEVERLKRAVRDFAGPPRVPVPAGIKAKLRPYQKEGLDFLAFVTDLGLGAVLADDMGLGKTVQALAWIEWLRERDPKGGPVLVVCPTSVVHNWQREAERFAPGLSVLVLASGEERHALRREVPAHDLVVTNYALLRRDIEHWRKIPLRAAILDEAQNVKNPRAAVSHAALALDARHRMALTGTPIENRALDLWSIMEFVNPGYLGRRTDFSARYDRPDAPAYTRRLLAARLRPVMLRRLKEQVAPDLPDRIEERRECELTPGQRRLYLAELLRGRETVARLKASPGGIREHKIEVLALLTRLRQVCCHPALAGGRADLGSGKFDALFEILDPLMGERRKVLVFSQFVECLKLLAAEMKRRGSRFHMLTGETTKREQVVRAFEDDPEPCVFLISLKAGGTGLNLVAAQYVVLFDPWWNPAVEAQAIDRTHRIGQTRTVIAYRLTAAGTVEDKIWELQQRKQRLVKEVLGEDGFAKTLTAGDLEYLLG